MTVSRSRMRADAAERAMRAWSMRVRGETWQQIAVELGYQNDANVIRAVRRYFGTLPELYREDLRALWRERHEVVWRIALDDVLSRRPGAVRAATAVARSASQLDGLDSPQRFEVAMTDDQERELALVIETGMRALGTLPAAEADIFDS
jgi:hypothetical protein